MHGPQVFGLLFAVCFALNIPVFVLGVLVWKCLGRAFRDQSRVTFLKSCVLPVAAGFLLYVPSSVATVICVLRGRWPTDPYVSPLRLLALICSLDVLLFVVWLRSFQPKRALAAASHRISEVLSPAACEGEPATSTGLLWNHLSGLALVAGRSFAGTAVILSIVGLALSGASFYVLEENTLWASVAALVAFFEAVCAGLLLGGKRAMGASLVYLISRLQPGRAAVRACFRVGETAPASPPSGPGGAPVIQIADPVPLAQMPQRLATFIADLVPSSNDSGFTGWWQRRLRSTLLRLVPDCAFDSLRGEQSLQGEGAFTRLQADLESRIDHLLLARIKRGSNRWTVLVTSALLLLVCTQLWLAHSKL